MEQQLHGEQEEEGGDVETAEDALTRHIQIQDQLRKAPQSTVREGNELLRRLEQVRILCTLSLPHGIPYSLNTFMNWQKYSVLQRKLSRIANWKCGLGPTTFSPHKNIQKNFCRRRQYCKIHFTRKSFCYTIHIVHVHVCTYSTCTCMYI